MKCIVYEETAITENTYKDIEDFFAAPTIKKKCTACDGNGETENIICDLCDGTGFNYITI